MGLSNKQKQFLDQYIKTPNFIQTELRVGFKIKIDKKACKKYLKKHTNPREFYTEKDVLIKTQYAIALAKPLDYINERTGWVIEPKHLSDEQSAAVKSVRYTPKGIVYGYILHDKAKALEILMKYRGMFPKEGNTVVVQTNVDASYNEKMTADEAEKYAIEQGLDPKLLAPRKIISPIQRNK